MLYFLQWFDVVGWASEVLYGHPVNQINSRLAIWVIQKQKCACHMPTSLCIIGHQAFPLQWQERVTVCHSMWLHHEHYLHFN